MAAKGGICHLPPFVFGEPRLGHGMMNAASAAAMGGNAQSVRMLVYEPNDETVENLGDTCPFRKS